MAEPLKISGKDFVQALKGEYGAAQFVKPFGGIDKMVVVDKVVVEGDIEIKDGDVFHLPIVILGGDFRSYFWIQGGDFRSYFWIQGGDFRSYFWIQGGDFRSYFWIQGGDFRSYFWIQGGDFRSYFRIQGGDFRSDFLIQGGDFRSYFRIQGGDFRSDFLIQGGDFRSSFWIQGGDFRSYFWIQGGDFRSYFLIQGGDFRSDFWIQGGNFRSYFRIHGGDFRSYFRIHGGDFRSYFRIQGGDFRSSFLIHGGGFRSSFLIQGGNFRSYFWIQGGDFRSYFRIHGGDFRSYFRIRGGGGLKALLIGLKYGNQHICPCINKLQLELNTAALIEVQNAKVNQIHLTQTLRSGGVLRLNQLELNVLEIKDFSNFGCMVLTDVKTHRSIDGEKKRWKIEEEKTKRSIEDFKEKVGEEAWQAFCTKFKEAGKIENIPDFLDVVDVLKQDESTAQKLETFLEKNKTFKEALRNFSYNIWSDKGEDIKGKNQKLREEEKDHHPYRKFNYVEREGHREEQKLSFLNSNLGHTECTQLNYQSFDTIEVENTRFSEMIQYGEESRYFFPVEIKKGNKLQAVNKISDLYQVYRDLNVAMGKQEDIVRKLRYTEAYQRNYARYLAGEKRGWNTRFSIWVNHWSNNFGQSWGRGVVFTLVLGMLFYLIYLWALWYFDDAVYCLPTSAGASNFISWYIEFIFPLRSLEVIEGIEASGGAKLIALLGKIVVGLGIYQTIQAFRKFGRK